MQRFFLSLFAVFFTVALPMHEAEAKRMGGGKSYGMQRDAPTKREAAPSQNQAQTPPAGNAAGQAAGGRSWMGPIAGLAAGLGLAALFSHLGLGEEMANFLMLALLALAAFMLIRWFMRRNQPAARPAMQYAGAGPGGHNLPANPPARFAGPAPMPGSVAAELGNGQVSDYGHLPPGFDAEGFTRQAKVNFIRLQAAYDAGDLDDIRAFTAPEMYAEIKLDVDERRGATQKTEVVELDAEVLEAVEDGNRQIVSVRFHGLLREDSEQATPFDETWHLTRPADASQGWLIAGIQQNG
jgi:predicted lipid-binding transport protein (Tim44 family)